MENKEVEQILLEGDIQHPLIIGYIEQLEKENKGLKSIQSVFQFDYEKFKELKNENAELIQQVTTKDKALDKACEELETFDMAFNNKDFDDVKSKEKWKEYVEHG